MEEDDVEESRSIPTVLRDVEIDYSPDEPQGPMHRVRVHKDEVQFSLNFKVVASVPLVELSRFTPGSEDLLKMLDIFSRSGLDAAVSAFK